VESAAVHFKGRHPALALIDARHELDGTLSLFDVDSSKGTPRWLRNRLAR
jgi:hypothetical protein